ncbi:PREDICTED: uncharacterized protein LOC105955734 [Erythranthe guttata]|uniref:uncharacterized protein LOC105955734 n=1 Tax=Erythranthe guttata TaxID=4155 RepID=UPI00064D81E1|nr:PREDICTED: uncharacterized protein LOC105955734 [Erythranthe guttata]|eukprot:XP_012834981.1 PREDICTED: uncharacterized protein LOC105955734 [Erythranthe guttata]
MEDENNRGEGDQRRPPNLAREIVNEQEQRQLINPPPRQRALHEYTVPTLNGTQQLFWKKEIHVDLISFSSHHIDVEVRSQHNNLIWRCTGFYGYPEHENKPKSWDLLRTLHPHRSLLWMIGGDFNEILSNSENEGGLARLPYQIEAFREILDVCNLSDIGYEGYPFTWTNKREHPNTIRSRLDRACANYEWISIFPDAKALHLPFLGSDHIPIMVALQREPRVNKRKLCRPFRFEAMWIGRGECEDIIRQTWGENVTSEPMEDLIWKRNE